MGLSLAIGFFAAVLVFCIAAYPLKLYKRIYNPKSKGQNCLLFGVVLCCLLPAIYIFCTLDHENVLYPFTGLLENQNGYAQQFDAFLKGQLHLDFAPDKRILSLDNPYLPDARTASGAWYPWDRALFEGKYYSYFGIAPILTVYFPYYSLTGALPAPQTVCFIFALLATVAVALLVLRLVRLFVPNCNFCALVLAVVAAEAGSLIYMLQASADMYYIAVLGGILHLMLFLLFAFCAYRQEKTGLCVLFSLLSALNLVLTVLSRPNMALYAVVCIPIFCCIFFGKEVSLPQSIVKLLSFTMPAALGAAFVMWYNFARFGSVLEFGARYQLTVCDVSTYHLSAGLLLPALYHYFFQFPQLKTDFPYIALTYESFPHGAGYLYVAKMLGAFSFPSLTGIVLSPVTFQRKRSNVKPLTFTLAFACCVTLAFLDTCFGGVCVRYLADVAPIAAVFSGVILLDLQTLFMKNSKRVQSAVFLVVCLLFLLTAFVGFLLIFENERNYILTVQ